MKASEYSLWLMPTGELYDYLSGLIKKLAGENKAPAFEPHVTLLGEIIQSEEDVIKKTKKLILDQKQFPITLTSIDYQDLYFRSLFIKAEASNHLLSLYDRTKNIFNIREPSPYFPHLSLLYGDFPPALKEKIIKQIGKVESIRFTVNSMHLFKTEGEVNAWKRVKEFHFTSRHNSS